MRDLKTLEELAATITNWKSLEKMSCKSFKPSILDLAISQDAPHLYNETQLNQLKNFSKLFSSVESKSNTNKTDKSVTLKRQIEEMPKEEKVMPTMIKKSRRVILTQNKSLTNSKIRIILRQNTPSPDMQPDLQPSPDMQPDLQPSPDMQPNMQPSPDLQPSPDMQPNLQPLPDLPIQFKNRVTELSGHDLKFLMHKRLFSSDVKTNSNRLSMPIKEITCEFLTQADIEKLDERNVINERLVGLEVIVLDPCLREFTLLLKKWSMQRTDTLNLVKKWNDIVSTNKFEIDQEFHIWSFRVDNKLYFLLNKL